MYLSCFTSFSKYATWFTIHENAFYFDVQPVHDLVKINTKRSWSSFSRDYSVTYTRPSIKLISHEKIQQLPWQFTKMHFILMFSQFMTSERSTQREVDPASLVTILWRTINQTYKSRENTAITLTIHENAFHFDVQPVHDLGKINTKRSWSSFSRDYPVTYHQSNL